MSLRILLALVLAALLWPTYRPAAAQGANLVANGGFESGVLAGWSTCGGVRLVDIQAGARDVHHGRFALRFGGPTDGSCGTLFVQQLQARYQALVVPANASGLTLAFWYLRAGTSRSDDPGAELKVALSTDDSEPQVRILGAIGTAEAGGWNQARYELSASQVAAARGRTMYLSFQLPLPIYPGDDHTYIIDDLAVYAARLRTPLTATLPAALNGDTRRSLVGRATPNGDGVTVIANLNGTALQPVFDGALGNGAKKVRWSKDGALIGLLEDRLQAEPEVPATDWARITTLTVMRADGSGPRELYRSVGKKLVPGVPRGCRPPRSDCGPYDNPAIDASIIDFDWAPGGSTIALNSCIQSRYGDGHTDDAICSIQFLDVATAKITAEKIEPAFGVHWSMANRLLYRVGIEGPLVYQKAKGLYELDMAVRPLVPRLLFEHLSPSKPIEDVAATWAPDGRRFVTLRFLPGNHYDANGYSQSNAALMLFDRNSPAAPRQLVLLDYGRSLAAPTWSPDGRYIAYSVEVASNSWETWWLDLHSGATGPMAADVAFADWRPSGPGALRTYLPAVRR